jgi:hypothetical protein
MFLINVGVQARSLRIVGIFFIIDGSLAGAAGVAGVILALSGHPYPWLVADSFCSGAVIAAFGVLLIAASRRTRSSSDTTAALTEIRMGTDRLQNPRPRDRSDQRTVEGSAGRS